MSDRPRRPGVFDRWFAGLGSTPSWRPGDGPTPEDRRRAEASMNCDVYDEEAPAVFDHQGRDPVPVVHEGEPGYEELRARVDAKRAELARRDRETAKAFAVGTSRGEARPRWFAQAYPWGDDARIIDERMDADA